MCSASPPPPPPPHPPSYAYNAQPPPPFSVVRLRRLPFDCAEPGIVEFFSGLDIVDILLVNKDRRFSGEAFCVLGYPLQVDFALQRNKQNMGRRYIEVFRTKRQEYYRAIADSFRRSTSFSPRLKGSEGKVI
ncbi:hypothetical protein IFM89_027015 [Coptis chinensis]|uniref:RRM domain-containing protein n=1 Tax=Coptis chinensis TaxID=261450 RepID=A0A835I3U5_9MAGN|nr:hypothetical protein IFM89_027015 [Coptis chinensis]